MLANSEKENLNTLMMAYCTKTSPNFIQMVLQILDSQKKITHDFIWIELHCEPEAN